MTSTESRKRAAQLAIEENFYLLAVYELQEKYPDCRELADYCLECAHALCHEQNKIWSNIELEDSQ